jgi:hypothetical protein
MLTLPIGLFGGSGSARLRWAAVWLELIDLEHHRYCTSITLFFILHSSFWFIVSFFLETTVNADKLRNNNKNNWLKRTSFSSYDWIECSSVMMITSKNKRNENSDHQRDDVFPWHVTSVDGVRCVIVMMKLMMVVLIMTRARADKTM